MKTIAIYHSADFDGLFCREIARKFLPDAELIGWDFGNKPLDDALLAERLYVLDLPLDRPFGLEFKNGWIWKNGEECHPVDRWDSGNITWIDHHATSIASHPADIPGYRIDGVAACRLAWQWFTSRLYLESGAPRGDNPIQDLPIKSDYVERRVTEPLAVRLAGEYDIWDRRDPNAELFQHGLRSKDLTEEDWKWLLTVKDPNTQGQYALGMTNVTVIQLLQNGRLLQYAKTRENESIIKHNGFTIQFEGLTFLACNAARYNSHLFTAGLKPEHDACFGFNWDGEQWKVSLYHAPGKEHHDLSKIALKHGGGGHKGACGFSANKLPFI